ncbi:Butyryl-CoA:acetate CoA-transferase [Fusobacterium sp. DD29]|uniref:butyryl-CoA:acetate CoA-transferase n=1 Tax=unclassified Fusobacterium TaxID=2648384 RepID=UPI001B8D1467|nr:MULTISPECIES: butyryl-CoA:acetate CoA-transferase [unclassified Fusobacterium]MBR8700526.1 Butyryl-CoA:acetate CoA-transferase [Fusobacterium sp. DD45]MBR8710275.1 Butyryl-CoA:acetate CoA-transferase [Fusobacterium sp. DD28]MBR8749581.1 Butyryl-CoA:acetate CoA-transferase [Fusobacterium sp. DD29]MBR8750839.1 Butyryl-CoA:acetate CoA-transferase [Fusobacterium sp. DD26]MBR8761831.1 Butyryl-CoA:acetate CoA-transferase [Fusobacterium sp. DD25]
MTDFKKMYKEKLVTPEVAAGVIKSGDEIDYGWCGTTNRAVDKALAKRMPSLENVIIRGGILLWVPEIFKIDHPEKHFTWYSWHSSGIERKLIDKGLGFYSPIRYSEVPRYYRDGAAKVDVAIMQVTPMDESGYFNFSVSPSHSAAVCEVAKHIIVEVNENMPVCLGGFSNTIHISEVDMVVEGENPMPAILPAPTPSEVDMKVAELIVEELQDGCCIQLGIGAMPTAVGSLIAKSNLKDLSVHSEMYVDAFVEMAKAGKITGKYKSINPGRQTFTFASGGEEMYKYLHNNPEIMAAPVDYVNDVRVVSSIDNFVSINNAVDIDLFGQVNAESAGSRHISGAGGQLDFVLGAYLSKGGKTFICLSSTYKTKDGTLKSRIRPTLADGSIVTDTRANVQYVVTEYGKVNLKGLSGFERAKALISIAHPDFREELIEAAKKLHLWKEGATL